MNPPEPLVYPPPCSQTMTGRLPDAPTLGVQTLSRRQSSLSGFVAIHGLDFRRHEAVEVRQELRRALGRASSSRARRSRPSASAAA